MSIESVVADILSASVAGEADPSVAMTDNGTPTNAVAVAAPIPRRETANVTPRKPGINLRPEVDGKVSLPVDGTPFRSATVYPKGYMQLSISKYQKFVVYESDFAALCEFFTSPRCVELLEAAKATDLFGDRAPKQTAE